MLMELITVDGSRALYEGWPEEYSKDQRYRGYSHLYSMPLAQWKAAGRPTAVHVTTTYTISLPV